MQLTRCMRDVWVVFSEQDCAPKILLISIKLSLFLMKANSGS